MIDPAARAALAARLWSIYSRIQELRDVKPDIAPARTSGPTPFTWRDPSAIPTRLESVKDAPTGLAHAVWLIGEAIALTGGYDALQAVYDDFSAKHGEASSWLNHRWDGVADLNGATWAS